MLFSTHLIAEAGLVVGLPGPYLESFSLQVMSGFLYSHSPMDIFISINGKFLDHVFYYGAV